MQRPEQRDEVEMLALMLLIRRFEERASQQYQAQKIGAFCHLYIGQEAVVAGAVAAVRDDDYIITAYRDHGHALARGTSANACMAELFGKATGCTQGLGGSMHFFDKKNHMYGGHAIVGAHVPLAAGLAFASKYRDEDRVTLCFFGDGAINQGSFHEALNLIALYKLPVVLICENNLFAMGTSVKRSTSLKQIVDRAGIGKIRRAKSRTRGRRRLLVRLFQRNCGGKCRSGSDRLACQTETGCNGMREITYRQALNEALAEELERDPNVFLMGEEVAEYNGAYKVSQGLLERFGAKRIIDTPISENGFAGLGVGAAMVGLRPVIEFMTFSFSLVAFDQVVNNAPNMLTMSGGQFNIPITFRGPNGPAHQLGATHSHATECLYANVPGLKVCTPATPRDAKGLLKTAVRDNNPVLVLEAELLYGSKGLIEPAETELLIPLGQAEVKREGADVTVVCYAHTVSLALAAAEQLEDEDISAEVLDLRSIKPLDERAIYDSVAKTHRVVIVEQDRPFCGVGAEVCYRIQKNIFDELDAPIGRVSQEDVPLPYNERLEKAVLPNKEKLVAAVKKVCYA